MLTIGTHEVVGEKEIIIDGLRTSFLVLQEKEFLMLTYREDLSST
jgi:hypothetical protein